MAQVSIKGLDKAEVLAALFNASRQQGMGFMDTRGAKPMSVEDAREVLKSEQDFDYLRGRVMKIGLRSDMVETAIYNRDNGQGAAERAIDSVRAKSAA